MPLGNVIISSATDVRHECGHCVTRCTVPSVGLNYLRCVVLLLLLVC